MSLEAYYKRPHNQRVAILATNVVCPAGNNLEAYRTNVNSGLTFITSKDISLGDYTKLQYIGDVSNLDLSHIVGGKQLKRSDDYARYAVGAAIPALLKSGLLVQTVAPSRTVEAQYDLRYVGPFEIASDIGVAVGGTRAVEKGAETQMLRGKVYPVVIMLLNPAKGATDISKITGFKKTSITHNMACSSGVYAYEIALRRILGGELLADVAGGTDSAAHFVAYEGFTNLGVLAQYNPEVLDPSKPLRKDREGFVIGQGAGVSVLARLDFAVNNNLPVIAEVAGAFSFTDTDDEYEPRVSNVELLINGALESAGLKATDVDELNTHTAGTVVGDEREIQGGEIAFGSHAALVTVRSPKLNIGHLMGGAGGVESTDAILSVMHNEIPHFPYGNLMDTMFDLPRELRKKEVRVVLKTSLGLDGQFASLVFVKPDPRFRR